MPDHELSAESTEVNDLIGLSLAARLVAGDERALEESYRLYGSIVRRYLRRFVGPEEADDLLQVVYLEVWRAREKIDPSRRLEAWLFGIARKRAIDHLRRRRHDVVAVDSVRELIGDDGNAFAERLAWTAEIQVLLASLSSDQREAISLSYFAGLSQREIAKYLEVPLGTVKARMARGMRQLSVALIGGVEQ
jgi:RNA polymerase sigma-70 factor (ECF subfamily)